jgi:hypothetical protein
MIYVKRDIRDDELLQIIRGWIAVLSQKRYDDFFDALGYSMGGESASAEWIKSDLSRYRSDLYPGVTEFEVTSWTTAQGGNPYPKAEVVRYMPNESRLAGAVTFTLPLNGMWSDASADFVLFETDAKEGFLLQLEEITIPVQS